MILSPESMSLRPMLEAGWILSLEGRGTSLRSLTYWEEEEEDGVPGKQRHWMLKDGGSQNALL